MEETNKIVNQNQIVNEDEIDLLELFQFIWSKKVFISKVTVIFLSLGLFIAFTSKVEYTASCKLLLENTDGGGMMGSLGGLGGLAGLAGINLSDLNTGSGHLSPNLYPEIMKSTPFLTEVIQSPLFFEKLDTTLSSFQYFSEIAKGGSVIMEYTIGLPGKIKNLFIDDTTPPESERIDIQRFSIEEWKLFENYADRLNVTLDEETGIIEIESEMPDPVASAQLTELLVQKLTYEITEHKIEKVKEKLSFVESQFERAQSEYNLKQGRVANFADQNRNITTSVVQAEYERLQNEMDIAFAVYKELASQLEQTKIQLKDETPIFSVLEPVRIPEDKSKPKRSLIVLICGFLGALIAVSYMLISKSLTANKMNKNVAPLEDHD